MKPPLLSGARVVKALLRAGYRVVSQRGSHIKLCHDDKEITLIVPNHKVVDRWTLKGIIRDAELSIDDFMKFV